MKEKLMSALKWFFRSFVWLFIVMLAIDIATKQIVMSFNVSSGSTIADWGIVRISYVLNPNAAFGLGADNPVVSRVIYLIVASLITIGIVVYLILKRKSMKLYIRACLILIISGAIGNMIDRIFYSGTNYCVVDWRDFYWFWGYNFNIADSCVVVAAFMLVIYIIVMEVKDAQKRRKEEGVEVKHLSQTEKEKLDQESEEAEKPSEEENAE